jgi:hypothetical protein
MERGSSKAITFRQRAAELRADAESVTDPELKQKLLDIAASFEMVAAELEANVRQGKN